jgi:hypothetical protein
MVTVAASGSILLPVAAASAAPLPQTTLYFHSANGGYSADHSADPGGTQTGRAPAGSTLTTAAPTGTTAATATYHPGPQNSGLPNVPTFALPSTLVGSASNVCIDVWLTSTPDTAFGGGVLSRFAKPSTLPGGTSYANTVLDPVADLNLQTPIRVKGLVNTATLANSLSGMVFNIYGYTNANTELALHYDSAAYPSSITINADPDLCHLAPPSVPGGGSPGVEAPTFTDYALPEDLVGKDTDLYYASAEFCGEPTLGVNYNTSNVQMICGPYTYSASFDDSTSPAMATFRNATPPAPGFASLDPILHVDPITGRTFNSQLLGATSSTLYSDDDGANWGPTQGSGQPHGADHQTIGAGPMHADVSPLATSDYGRRSVYYCSQSVAVGLCAQSRDGGLTYDPAVPTYTVQECGGLHGHVQVGPAGEVYLPNRNCQGGQAVARSLDGNKTWSVQRIPGGHAQGGSSDPGLAVGSGGTLYLGYEDADGRPKVSVSRDKGDNWSTPVSVGVPYGIRNAQFTTMTAGDDDRAAFAFLGTTTAGDDQAADFPGVWHLYISTTYDYGRTWTTVQANAGNIAQRGCIWLGGGDNPCRNLLDFMDVTVDRTGRVLVGWADGCFTSACQAPAGTAAQSTSAKGTITRQASGLGLFRSLDGFTPTTPDAVIPEAPFGALLPLAAVVLMGTAYQFTRRRRSA